MIEFALALAFLLLLVAAAVDAGLAYKSYQNLINAAANASSFLAQYPYAYDGSASTIAEANNKALDAFRFEQGTGTLGIGRTRDLNGDGAADNFGSGYSAAWNPWFRIDTASSAEVATHSPTNFRTYAGTADSQCSQRSRFDTASTANDKKPCYIVVRAQMIYKPFLLSPVFGNQMTIRAFSVKPIVGLPTSAYPSP